MKFFFLMGAAYVAGSVNFAILLFRLLGKKDPRAGFSGNAGTTNVYRQAGPLWAAAVLLLDVGRAAAVALLAGYALTPGQVPWVALALVAGNRFPCFHGFRGGKGVANYLGFTAVIAPIGAAVGCAVWVAVYLVKRAPFIASFAMIVVLSGATIIASGYRGWAVAGALSTALFIVWNHRENIEAAMNRPDSGETPVSAKDSETEED